MSKDKDKAGKLTIIFPDGKQKRTYQSYYTDDEIIECIIRHGGNLKNACNELGYESYPTFVHKVNSNPLLRAAKISAKQTMYENAMGHLGDIIEHGFIKRVIYDVATKSKKIVLEQVDTNVRIKVMLDVATKMGKDEGYGERLPVRSDDGQGKLTDDEIKREIELLQKTIDNDIDLE